MERVTLTLTPADLQVVLNALASRPLGEVLDAFMSIRQQIAQQQGQQEPRPASNGAAQHMGAN